MINLEELKKKCVVFDIETSAVYPDSGKKIDIRIDFENYVKYAKVKWFGAYSYKDDCLICDQAVGNEDHIREFMDKHEVLVGYNNEDFDTPIMLNNGLMSERKHYKQVDCLPTLAPRTFAKRDGTTFKGRGGLMGFKTKNNQLRTWAQALGLKTQKGDIDYNIFFQDVWTEEQKKEIIMYLKGDVMATKEMFDMLWQFWKPFTKFISEKNVENLSWIRSSIASLTYKAACFKLGVEETYGEPSDKPKEEMGGRVIEPKYQEARGVWYVDFASLYPHIYAMFNLFAEIDMNSTLKEATNYLDKKLWNGNDVFKVKGYYDISTIHPLSLHIAEFLKRRIWLKKNEPDNPEIYAIKIFLNSLYGAQRSPIFEQIHTENGGWDCCWLGQQIQELTETMMGEMGFETIAGDTDSIFILPKEGTDQSQAFVKECLAKVVNKIKANAPFPVDTFDIDLEIKVPLEYVMWPFSMQPIEGPDGKNLKEGNRLIKKLKGKKKNYVYTYKMDGSRKLKIMGLPIIKDNATALGQRILERDIKPRIMEHGTAKFSKEVINGILNYYIKDSDNLSLLAREFKVKPAHTYKSDTQLQAQISEGYFGGQDGVAYLIKNKSVGKAGKGSKYATAQEIIEAGLSVDDLDLTKVKNELEPFVEVKNGK